MSPYVTKTRSDQLYDVLCPCAPFPTSILFSQMPISWALWSLPKRFKQHSIFAKVVPPMLQNCSSIYRWMKLNLTPHPVGHFVRSNWMGNLAKIFQRHIDLRSLGAQSRADFTGGWAAADFADLLTISHWGFERFGFSDWMAYISAFTCFFHDKVSDSVRFDGVHLGPSCQHSFTRSPISTLGHQVLNSSHYSWPQPTNGHQPNMKLVMMVMMVMFACGWRWASWSDQRWRFPGTDWRFFLAFGAPAPFGVSQFPVISCEHFPALSRCTVKLPAMLPVMTWDIYRYI